MSHRVEVNKIVFTYNIILNNMSTGDSNPIIAPTNQLVCPLLTDFYQISMSYAYWKCGKANDHAVFELFFRKNPFKGEFTIFAGIDEILKFLSSFRFSESDIDYLKTLMPHCEQGYWDWLRSANTSELRVYAMAQGEVCFPRIPLIRVEGPLALAQLMETTFLNLVNFPSLIATNAARMKMAVELNVKPRLRPNPKPAQLLEFGIRRAQGPDGGFSATKYSYIGGFHGTSNVLAGKLEGIPVVGTNAHSFITSFYEHESYSEGDSIPIQNGNGETINFLPIVISCRNQVMKHFGTTANYGELIAFASYASAFPKKFIALVDTFDTLQSGVINFLAVGLALQSIGYSPVGIRLDSGDLAYLSKEARRMFIKMDEYLDRSSDPLFSDCVIVASNDLNEDTIVSLNNQGHEIDIFAIGTNLVTCQKQPALGCVFKLVEVNGSPRIKLSQDSEKIVIPSKKFPFRLYGSHGEPILDLMVGNDEAAPVVGQRIYCRHPFIETKRAYVTPGKVEPLLHLIWDGPAGFRLPIPTLLECQQRCKQGLASMREDHLRFHNPTPYKISISGELHEFLHNMILKETPVPELG